MQSTLKPTVHSGRCAEWRLYRALRNRGSRARLDESASARDPPSTPRTGAAVAFSGTLCTNREWCPRVPRGSRPVWQGETDRNTNRQPTRTRSGRPNQPEGITREASPSLGANKDLLHRPDGPGGGEGACTPCVPGQSIDRRCRATPWSLDKTVRDRPS